MRQLLPFPAEDITPYEVYRPDEGTDRFLRVNMVSSVDGRATDPSGVTAQLGGEGDHELFRALRALADGILVGAGTVRREGYGPHRVRADLATLRRRDGRARPAAIIIVSGALDLDPGSRVFAEAATPTIVVTHAAAPADRRRRLAGVARVVVAGTVEVDLVDALDQLASDHGITHVLCEGGPTLNRSLLRAGLVDELCLTLAPVMFGTGMDGIVRPVAPTARMELLGLCEHDSELYARYGVHVSDDDRPQAPNR
jgi:riboflavin-specific deaminase-like protein